MFLGVELVNDTPRRDPATELATYVVERVSRLGVLLSTDGPHHNVLKIKPPLPFDRHDVDRLCEVLGQVLSEPTLRVLHDKAKKTSGGAGVEGAL